MSRRRLLIVAAGLSLFLAGPFVVRWATTPAIVPGPTEENFWRLRVGMSMEQVTAILGTPSRPYWWFGKDGKINIDQFPALCMGDSFGDERAEWSGCHITQGFSPVFAAGSTCSRAVHVPRKATMSRRRLLLLAAAVCLLAIPFVARLATTPAPGVTLENFKRLHRGMTLEEVEAIMGRSPDDSDDLRRRGGNGIVRWWYSEEAKVHILTSHHDSTYYAAAGGFERAGIRVDSLAEPSSAIGKIRRWLRL